MPPLSEVMRDLSAVLIHNTILTFLKENVNGEINVLESGINVLESGMCLYIQDHIEYCSHLW